MELKDWVLTILDVVSECNYACLFCLRDILDNALDNINSVSLKILGGLTLQSGRKEG
jgi:hypothetical protein